MGNVQALAFAMPGMMEWAIILAIALLLFGRRLPEVMRGLGGGVREFRKGIEGAADEATGKNVSPGSGSHLAGDKAPSTSDEGAAPSQPKS